MAGFLFNVAVLPTFALLLFGAVPDRLANRRPRRFAAWVTGAVTASLVATLAMACQVAFAGPYRAAIQLGPTFASLRLTLMIDSLSALMAALISLIGFVIARYSLTYLRTDARQGRFFRWIGFTLGAVLLMVTAGDLILFAAAWMLTSLGLHQLLTHYSERPWAVWAARKKFLISRLGDVLLITAVALAYQTFGTTEYEALFAAAQSLQDGSASGSLSTGLIGILLVLGAMTKSAQFPFHSWLPDTMEAPTPVSALMHAGVINAGGFLVIRLSPLVSLSPVALDLLALVGAATALLGSVVMLTQTSVKRSLAYSTIAQMGFMMLQCGLGAFTAALLHIVAHSAYKAHAFLSCGSVLDRARLVRSPDSAAAKSRAPAALLLAIGVASGMIYGLLPLAGISLAARPGGPVLSLILTMALAQLLWQGFASGRAVLTVRGLGAALLLLSGYLFAYQLVDSAIAESASLHTANPSHLHPFVAAIVIAMFAGVFVLQSLLERAALRPWARRLYVHAMNGFYVDIPARRITAFCFRQSAPVQ